MISQSIAVIALALATLSSGCKSPEVVVPTKDWWETAQFYQIYPRSFKDSNNDGIGDLNGITSKLQHLKDIGVTATWLSPIFKSPMADFGYDISDFYSIQDEYGTMEDFENLVSAATKLGLKVILDFVPNHSSDESEWFIKSVNRERGYEDFYVWHDGYPDPNNPSKRLPPSNWLSVFRGSAWEWNDKRQQFYLHQFVAKQPDLNYRNPRVVETMKGVLRYWLDRGVAGFRIDAVPNLFEVAPDANGNYPDEPLSGTTNDPEDSAYLNHIYTTAQPETIDMVYQWREVLDDYQRIHGGHSRVLLIETYAAVDYTMKFYGNRTTRGAHLPFNFNLIMSVNSQTNAPELTSVIARWLDNMPSGRTANWVIGNHDQRRAASRYGVDRMDFMNMLVMLLPGVSVTYQGEELGMIDGYLTWEETVDPAACNSNPSIYENFSRDPARTPFQWDSSENAGFSSPGVKTWLPVAASYKDLNVAVENATTKSHLKVYQSLVNLRQSRTLQFGDYKYGSLGNDIFVLERYLENEDTIVLVGNLNNDQQQVNLNTFDSTLPSSLKVQVANSASNVAVGTSVSLSNLSLGPYEALVLTGR